MKTDFLQQKKKNNQRRNPEFEAMKRKRKMDTYSSSLSKFGIRLKSLKYIFIAGVLVALGLGAFSYLLRNDYYSIKKIEVYGNNRISTDSLNIYMNKYIDTNLVSINKREILSGIETEFIELEDINLVKVYPDLLKIEVIETLPSLVYFDFDSTELISSRGQVVGIINSAPASFTETEVAISQTGGDPNADYIKSKLQGEKEGAFQWDTVPQEERMQALNAMKADIDNRVVEYINKTIENILNTSFKDLLIVYRKSFGSESISPIAVNFNLKMAETINSKGLEIARVGLLNKFDLAYELTDNKMIIFTTRRDADLQLDDLNTIIINSQFGSGSVFDFRSANFSIK